MKNIYAAFVSLGGEWRQHPLYPRYYFSRDGRAARLGVKRVRPLVGCSSGRGYRAISCADGSGKYKRVYIHRAVCELFNGAPSGQVCARHLDGDMLNNAAHNLAWGAAIDNSGDARRHGRTPSGARNPCAKLTAEKVVLMRTRRLDGVSFRKLGAEFGVTAMTAFRATTERAWK